MPLTLPYRLIVLLAALAVTAIASGQSPPLMPGGPAAGGSYAVPIGAPINLSGSVPVSTPTTTTPAFPSGPAVAGNSVFMAPEIVGPGRSGGGGCSTCGPNPGAVPYRTMAPPVVSTPPMGGAPVAPVAPAPGGVPLGIEGGPELIYPGFVDPSASIPAGTGFRGFGAPAGLPAQPAPVATSPFGAGGFGYGTGRRCGLSAGFTFVFLAPVFGSNNAFFVGSPTASGYNASGQNFDYDLDLSPRVFAQWIVANDFGFRVTWFGYNNSANSIGASAAPQGFIQRPLSPARYFGGQVSAGSNLSLNTLDFDLTQGTRFGRSLFNFGGGLRWANYEQNYTSTISHLPIGQAGGRASQQFNGFGPTLFAEWRRPIGRTRFSLLANVRGSMLYGDSQHDSYERLPSGGTIARQSQSGDFVFVGETQLGGEWSTWISRQTVFFAQLAFEGQYWMGVGTAFDQDNDLGLFGFNTTLGLEW